MKRRIILILFLLLGLIFIYINVYGQEKNGRITGLVKSNYKRPIEFATIKLIQNGKNIKNTVTDSTGKFTFENLPAGYYNLQFSSVGYKSQTGTGYSVKEGKTTAILIELQLSTDTLSGVVVTALGIKKSNSRLGYAVSTVDGSLLNQAKEPNVAYSLEGRVAGVNITGLNGGPGSSARILIRGISNFSTGSVGPLFVINGVPMDNTQQGSAGMWGGSDMGDGISSINPDDIAEVTVLKGSTASALYGNRAVNGVIAITTKSGNDAKGIGIEFSSSFSVNQAIDNSDFQKVYGSGQHGVAPTDFNGLINNELNSWGPKFDGSMAINFDGNLHPYSAVINPRSNFYRVAPVVNNTLAFSSSGKSGNFRLSLSQLDNESIVPNSNLVRYTGNLNLNQNITDKLKLSVMADYTNDANKNRPYLSDFARNANYIVQFLPLNVNPLYLKPGYNVLSGHEMPIDAYGYDENPWFATSNFVNNTTRNRFITSSLLRYDFSSELFVQARLGLDFIADNILQYEPTGWGQDNFTGKLEQQAKQTTTELNTDVLIGYNHKINNHLGINVAIGGNIRKNDVEKLGISNNSWSIPYLYTPANSIGLNQVYNYSSLQTNSAYYTLDLDIEKYLTLSTTGRFDVFSTLPEGQRGIFTPSASASFLFGKLIDIPKLSFGKLRISFAQTAADALPYHNEITYSSGGNISGVPYGYRSNVLLDPNNVKAFKLKEFEIGTELAFFENRLGFNLTYFNRITSNELISKPISLATGYSTYYYPVGSTSNNGIELELKGSPLKTSNFAWNINFNFTDVNNKLINIGDNTPNANIPLDAYRPSQGGIIWAGDGSYVADVQGLPVSQIMVRDFSYNSQGKKIVNDNGIPIPGAFKPVGSGLPKYYGGLNNEFIYKNFVFSFLIDYRFGVKVLSGTNFVSTYYGLNKNTLGGRYTPFIVDGVRASDGSVNSTAIDAQTYWQGILDNGISAINVFDASFIKLRQLSIGYDFTNQNFIKKSPFTSLKLSLTGRNLATLLKHTPNFDPEDSYSALTSSAGLEGGNLPATRTIGLNLVLKLKN